MEGGSSVCSAGSDYGTWEDRGGKDSSLRTPIAQPIRRYVFPSGALPDLVFLIPEMRAFSKWWTIHPERGQRFQLAVSWEPPGAAFLRTVNRLAALFLGKRRPDADHSQ
jgi:hypothetical protein